MPIWGCTMPTSGLHAAKLGFHVYELLDRAEAQAAGNRRPCSAIKQPEVSHLMNGHFNRFTTDKLLEFLRRLDRKVTIQITPHKPGEPYQEVGFGA